MADSELEDRVAALEKQLHELVQIIDAIVAPVESESLEAHVSAARKRRGR